MADKKITELTAKTTPSDTDVLPIVDLDSTATTKKITAANLKTYVTPDVSSDQNVIATQVF
jgi:hypothetical protein